ncbi:hypothetical protein IEQ34_002370 [Dendrobium chrysotoxum]|uniref:Uncharacterized protein n=1 Tax=Dendrobium chrysotoxum TaxID=161865 RepID=A0AAV7HM32_DENCH|nr:hypothetical protein IEQ34_002370 [Dendrobium chrysotoxum]
MPLMQLSWACLQILKRQEQALQRPIFFLSTLWTKRAALTYYDAHGHWYCVSKATVTLKRSKPLPSVVAVIGGARPVITVRNARSLAHPAHIRLIILQCESLPLLPLLLLILLLHLLLPPFLILLIVSLQ